MEAEVCGTGGASGAHDGSLSLLLGGGDELLHVVAL